MKCRALLLSSILAACLDLPAFALAQDNQAQPAPASNQGQTQPQPAAAQDQEPSTAPDSKTGPPVKHDGGKNDVDAIGNRKVGGVDWYSIDTDIKIGKAAAQQMEPTMNLVHDPVVTEYVNRIGQNLVRNSDAKMPFTIKVVDDDEINAMALPGGILYVNTGLILAADDEAELAGAMAHEIAHVALRHYTRSLTRAQMAQILMTPAIIFGGPVAFPASQIGRIAVPMTLLKFNRDFEAEADYFGVQYMYKAGYDPNALVTIFEKIAAREKKKPGTLSKAFASHPQTPSRIQKTQKEIAAILPARDNYVETTSEFNDVKGQLALLRNQRRVEDASQNKPSLRRTANAPDSEKKEKDDNRPVLQRRDQQFRLSFGSVAAAGNPDLLE